jgi:hypothetical protein
VESIRRYYSGIVVKGRINAPTITEAKRDLVARTYLPYEA